MPVSHDYTYHPGTVFISFLILLAGCLPPPEAITILTPPEGFDKSSYFDTGKDFKNNRSHVILPMLKDIPKFKLTRQARMDKAKGTIILLLYINERGRIDYAEIKQKYGYGMDEEIARSLQNAKFSPAIFRGKAIKASVAFMVKFDAESQRSAFPRRPARHGY